MHTLKQVAKINYNREPSLNDADPARSKHAEKLLSRTIECLNTLTFEVPEMRSKLKRHYAQVIKEVDMPVVYAEQLSFL